MGGGNVRGGRRKCKGWGGAGVTCTRTCIETSSCTVHVTHTHIHTYTHTHTHKHTNIHTYLNKNIHTESKTMRDELRQPLRIGDCETEVPDTLDWRQAGTTTDREEGSVYCMNDYICV